MFFAVSPWLQSKQELLVAKSASFQRCQFAKMKTVMKLKTVVAHGENYRLHCKTILSVNAHFISRLRCAVVPVLWSHSVKL